MIDVLTCPIWIVICEQASVSKLFWIAEHSDSFSFVVDIEAFVLFFAFQRSPLAVAIFEVTCELSLIEFLSLLYFYPFSLFEVVCIEAFIYFIAFLLNSLSISEPILEIANINPFISVMHPIPMGFSILPLPMIILKPDHLIYLIHPNHFPFPCSSAIRKVAYVEIPIFIDLNPKAISFIEEQLSFIDLALLADDEPLPMPLAIHYCSYIELIIIDRYFGTSKSLQICKGSQVAFEWGEGHEVFRNLLVVCGDEPRQIGLPL